MDIDVYYLKIMFIIVIMIMTVFCLNFLFKILIITYFSKNNNLTISKKLPKKVYKYLNDLNFKNESQLGDYYKKFYLKTF